MIEVYGASPTMQIIPLLKILKGLYKVMLFPISKKCIDLMIINGTIERRS